MESFEARTMLGFLLRNKRARKGWNREDLAEHADLSVETVTNLEHGVVNPTKRDFEKVIDVLHLSRKMRGKAGWLLGIIHPRRKRDVKFHLHSSILKQRSPRRGYR